jgi:cytidylate kinase
MTTTQWGEAKSYDLVINSSKLGIDGTVDFLLNYIERLSK